MNYDNTTPFWLAISEVGKNPHGLDWWFCSIWFLWICHSETTNWDPHPVATAVGSISEMELSSRVRPRWMRKNDLQAWDTAIPGNQSSTLEIRCLFFSPTNSTTKANKKIHHWKTTLLAGGSTPKSCWLKGSGTEPGMREKSKLNSMDEGA